MIVTKRKSVLALTRDRGEKMRCIYLDKNDSCAASPIRIGAEADLYKPEPETLTKFCKHEHDMKVCPRLMTYQEHLKSSNK